MGIEVADREFLHLGEHLLSELIQEFLGKVGTGLAHEHAEAQSRYIADEKDHEKGYDLFLCGCPVAGLPVFADDLKYPLDKQGRNYRSDAVYDDTEDHEGCEGREPLEVELYYSLEASCRVLDVAK